MPARQGLNKEDWLSVRSKLAFANVEQLIFMKKMIDDEMVKRNGQQY